MPDVFIVTAEGIRVTYDPAGAADQKILTIDTAKIMFPRFEIQGSISPFTQGGITTLVSPCAITASARRCGNRLRHHAPGTTLRDQDRFARHEPQVWQRAGVRRYPHRVSKTSQMTFGAAVQFSGSIYIASGGARFFPGKPFNMTISDRNTADDLTNGVQNTEAVRVQLDFNTDGTVKGLQFKADTLTLPVQHVPQDHGARLFLNTGAAADAELVSFQSIGAELKVGSLAPRRRDAQLRLPGDGTFAPRGFGCFSVGSATGDSFKWPSWLLIKINAVGIQWDDLIGHPDDFVITLSASVTGLQGLGGLTFSGLIEGVKTAPSLLLEGKFPITDIAALGVSASGKMFGGELSAALIGASLNS